MEYVGKTMLYLTNQGELREATIREVKMHELLRQSIFIGISPYGHTVRLTWSEVHKII